MKDYYPKYAKKSRNSTIKTNNWVKKWAKEIQIVNKQMKDAPNTYGIREILIQK